LSFNFIVNSSQLRKYSPKLVQIHMHRLQSNHYYHTYHHQGFNTIFAESKCRRSVVRSRGRGLGGNSSGRSRNLSSDERSRLDRSHGLGGGSSRAVCLGRRYSDGRRSQACLSAVASSESIPPVRPHTTP
jgi:hypothetical protein